MRFNDASIFCWSFCKILREADGEDDGSKNKEEQCNNKGVDGDPVVLVLLVGVGAPQAKSGEEGPEEVADQSDDDEGRHEADVACAPSLRASNGGVHVEREWGGGTLLDALHEESLPPALGQDPVGRRRGRRHQDHSDEAACEGDHLEWPGDRDGLYGDLWGPHPAHCRQSATLQRALWRWSVVTHTLSGRRCVELGCCLPWGPTGARCTLPSRLTPPLLLLSFSLILLCRGFLNWCRCRLFSLGFLLDSNDQVQGCHWS